MNFRIFFGLIMVLLGSDVCAADQPNILKSRIPHDSGVYLRDDEITLAEVLQDTGYATAHIGQWHLNSDLTSNTEPQPKEQGFDYAQTKAM